MIKIAEYKQKSALLTQKTTQVFKKAGMELKISENDCDTLKLVFAGQYSAGKSSIAKMLTERSDIAIGAGITTQTAHKYEWNGLQIIDTPGIHTELRPDHDEIAYDAISSADMLVFVVTNELFDSHLAEHFRKLAIDKDKAGEMIVVVNKMQRTAKGNTETQQNIIREDLRKVFYPYTPEQLKLCFIDAESYFESLEEEDCEIAEELFNRSGYKDFIETLDAFVKEKNISSKLTTELYVLDEQIEKAIHNLEPKSIDEDIDILEESYKQQRHILIDAKERLQQEIKDIYTSASSGVRNIGIDTANLVTEGCDYDEVNQQIGEAIVEAKQIISNCQNKAIDILKTRLDEIEVSINEIKDSEFNKDFEARLINKFDYLPENIKKALISSSEKMTQQGGRIAKEAYKEGVQGGLKLGNFSGSKVHDIVLKIGNKIGYKFKPWEAVKITKGIAIGGQVLSFIGTGVSVFMQIKEDHEDEKAREAMKTNRRNIRQQFNDAANELETHGEVFVKDCVINELDTFIKENEECIAAIRETKTNRSNICKEIELLQNDCRTLIQEIHSI